MIDQNLSKQSLGEIERRAMVSLVRSAVRRTELESPWERLQYNTARALLVCGGAAIVMTFLQLLRVV